MISHGKRWKAHHLALLSDGCLCFRWSFKCFLSPLSSSSLKCNYWFCQWDHWYNVAHSLSLILSHCHYTMLLCACVSPSSMQVLFIVFIVCFRGKLIIEDIFDGNGCFQERILAIITVTIAQAVLLCVFFYFSSKTEPLLCSLVSPKFAPLANARREMLLTLILPTGEALRIFCILMKFVFEMLHITRLWRN